MTSEFRVFDTQLLALGYDAERDDEVAQRGLEGLVGRVVRVDRAIVTIETAATALRIKNLLAAPLIVGDWVVADGEQVVRLTRRTELVRRVGHRRDERQPIAANVDLVLVVRALDTDIRIGRLSALVVIAFDSGATPLVVLSKADRADDAMASCDKVSSSLNGVETIAISTVTGLGMDELRERIAGKTIVLLGESGAGKSTLTNALCGSDVLATSSVRRDGQGRHTTTHRQLVVIPSGGVVIDTPGVREAAAFGDGEGLELAFADVVELVARCRFPDCQHGDTPGCAVTAALEDGRLDGERLSAYLHETGEQAWLERRLDAKAVSAEKSNNKKRKRRLGDA